MVLQFPNCEIYITISFKFFCSVVCIHRCESWTDFHVTHTLCIIAVFLDLIHTGGLRPDRLLQHSNSTTSTRRHERKGRMCHSLVCRYPPEDLYNEYPFAKQLARLATDWTISLTLFETVFFRIVTSQVTYYNTKICLNTPFKQHL
jgi:hypothetical protein